MSDRDSTVLLNDVLESIQNIFEFTEGISFEQYCNDLKTRHVVKLFPGCRLV